jgi:hypothetical protein
VVRDDDPLILARRLLPTSTMASATRQRLLDGLAAGTVATLVMTALVFAAPAFGGPHLPPAAARVIVGLRAHPSWVLGGLLAHLCYGALAGALFVAGARAVSIAAGVKFALGLWGIAAVVYAPVVGLGFLASQRPGLAALAIPAHLLYGLVLGAVSPRGEVLQPSGP